MGLSSQRHARSVVEISLSPCYHYQFSSISKSVDELFKELEMGGLGQEEVAEKRLAAQKKFVLEARGFTEAL